MRILLAHKRWAIAGGAEIFFRETERVLREAGHETFMVASGEPSGNEPDNLLLLPPPAYDHPQLVRRFAALPDAIYDRSKHREVAALIDRFKPELFHAFSLNVQLSPAVLTAASDAGLPIVASFNDYKHICPNYKLFTGGEPCFACKGGKFHNAVVRNCCHASFMTSAASMLEARVHAAMGIYRKIDHLTFASEFMARVTQDFWPDRQLSWSGLQNPFGSADYRASEVREPYGIFFGRLVEEKGVDLILDAAADIGGFPLRIVGDGPEEARLRRRARDEGLTNVEFLGPLWGAALDEHLSRAAFSIVPSTWHENSPYAINQAFALGRPVIGSRRGGIPEMVEDGSRGLLFEPDHPGELAEAIRRLSLDPRRAADMGRAAKEWSDETYSDEVFLGQLLFAYERAIEQRRSC